MIYYEYGFLSKCAEYGVAEREAGALLKIAQQVTQANNEQQVIEDPVKVYEGPDDFAAAEGQTTVDNAIPTKVDPTPAPATTPAAQTSPVASTAQAANPAQTATDAQRTAVSNWAKSNGKGAAFKALFADQNGNIDNNAIREFIKAHPEFQTGTDQDRDNLIRMRMKQLTPQQSAAFYRSQTFKNYSASRYGKPQQQANTQQTVRRTYGTPRNTPVYRQGKTLRPGGRASFRQNMNLDFGIKDSDRTFGGYNGNMTSFQGQRGNPNSATFYRG